MVKNTHFLSRPISLLPCPLCKGQPVLLQGTVFCWTCEAIAACERLPEPAPQWGEPGKVAN